MPLEPNWRSARSKVSRARTTERGHAEESAGTDIDGRNLHASDERVVSELDPKEPSLVQRASGPPVTENLGNLAAPWLGDWPGVAARVRLTLLRRGFPSSTIDDALQETALRALRRTTGFHGPNGLLRWTMVVARRQAIAAWRKEMGVEVGDVVELSGEGDTAERVEARFRLNAVLDALGRLSEVERSAILSGLVERAAEDGPEPANVKMRRSRARRHLGALVKEWR